MDSCDIKKKIKQNYNRSFKTKQKRGTDVSRRVAPRVRKLHRDSSQLAAKQPLRQ